MSGRDDRLRAAWPALDSWQTQLTKGTVRVGDAERDQAASALGEHFAAGRLDRGEYDDRLAAVFAAKTWGDLAPIFRDLPGPVPTARPRPVAPPPPPAPRFRPPLLPLLLILLGLAVLTGHWFVLWIGLGAWWWMRATSRRARWAQASGSRRGTRGSWS